MIILVYLLLLSHDYDETISTKIAEVHSPSSASISPCMPLRFHWLSRCLHCHLHPPPHPPLVAGHYHPSICPVSKLYFLPTHVPKRSTAALVDFILDDSITFVTLA